MKCAVSALGIILFILCLFGFGLQRADAATTWYVDDDAPADFDTIQAAIDASSDGDTIIVRDGLYTGDGNRDIDFKGKAVHLRSEDGPEGCVIDCQGSEADAHRGFIFLAGEDNRSILDGFTITHGNVNSFQQGFGGAIDCWDSSPLITNNIIIANSADEGGGIACRGQSSPTIAGNAIIGNDADRSHGGGIHCNGSSPSIVGNTFTGNTSPNGAAISCEYGSSAVIVSNTISGNSASSSGAGIYVYLSSLSIANNIIADNTAANSGGGACFFVGSSATVINNTFTGNAVSTGSDGGGALCTWASAFSVTVSNCILWNNSADNGPEVAVLSKIAPSTLTVSYTNMTGGEGAAHVETDCTLTWGPGNFDADPLFADPDNGDYHLKSEHGRWNPNANGGAGDWVLDTVTSLCVNGGDPASDFSNEPMFNGERINVGAYGNTPEASKNRWLITADANFDDKIDILDLLTVRDKLQEDPTSGNNWRCDVNTDGFINILDLIYVRNHLGTRRE